MSVVTADVQHQVVKGVGHGIHCVYCIAELVMFSYQQFIFELTLFNFTKQEDDFSNWPPRTSLCTLILTRK